ncbi:Isopenicillin N epimerase [Hordeum vulgare]|nr:Isopenicillin N epimerase [Hordeum vulgare]
MEAARKAVSGFMVVGCLLSPFHVNPHAIIDELRATTWKNQGVVTVQEVASDDGRRDNFIFAEFDGKGNPVEVDLGVMAICAQVHDLTFELKTERHTSERFCNIASEKRVASYLKNLSVEAYWKAQGASKRALKFGSFSRGDKLPNAGTQQQH